MILKKNNKQYFECIKIKMNIKINQLHNLAT